MVVQNGGATFSGSHSVVSPLWLASFSVLVENNGG